VFDNRKNNIRIQLMKEHLDMVKQLYDMYSESISEEQRKEINAQVAAIELDINSKSKKDKDKNKYEFDKSKIFDSEYAKQ